MAKAKRRAARSESGAPAKRRAKGSRRTRARLDMAPELAGQLWDWLGERHAEAVRSDPYLAPVFDALARGDWRALSERGALGLVRASRATLQRATRQVFGTGYVKVALDFRLDQARRLLRETTEPIAAIAYAVGYPDPAVFRQAFRRRFGKSPAQYAPRPASKPRPGPWRSPADRE